MLPGCLHSSREHHGRKLAESQRVQAGCREALPSPPPSTAIKRYFHITHVSFKVLELLRLLGFKDLENKDLFKRYFWIKKNILDSRPTLYLWYRWHCNINRDSSLFPSYYPRLSVIPAPPPTPTPASPGVRVGERSIPVLLAASSGIWVPSEFWGPR